MLNKLLKYDLKYMIKNMSIFYILGLFFSITTRILFSLDQTVMVKIVGQISVGCMFAMVISIIINVVMRSWVRFRESIYKDEAYLTHTLPITKNDIYNSKFIQTLIFFIFSFVVALVCLFITYYTEERWILLKGIINKITTGLDFKPTLFVTCFILTVFLEIFNAIQCGFFGMILGHKKNNGKLGYSIAFGFIFYLVTQSLVLLSVYIVGLFNSSVMDLFNNTMLLDTGALKILVLVSSVLYIVIISIMNILCKRELNKGVNID